MYKKMIHKIQQRFAHNSRQPALRLLLVPIVCALNGFCYTCDGEAQVKFSTARQTASPAKIS